MVVSQKVFPPDKVKFSLNVDRSPEGLPYLHHPHCVQMFCYSVQALTTSGMRPKLIKLWYTITEGRRVAFFAICQSGLLSLAALTVFYHVIHVSAKPENTRYTVYLSYFSYTRYFILMDVLYCIFAIHENARQHVSIFERDFPATTAPFFLTGHIYNAIIA